MLIGFGSVISLALVVVFFVGFNFVGVRFQFLPVQMSINHAQAKWLYFAFFFFFVF